MVAEKMRLIDDSLAVRLDDRPQEAPQNIQQQQEQHNRSVLKCPKCNNDMYLRFVFNKFFTFYFIYI